MKLYSPEGAFLSPRNTNNNTTATNNDMLNKFILSEKGDEVG